MNWELIFKRTTLGLAVVVLLPIWAPIVICFLVGCAVVDFKDGVFGS